MERTRGTETARTRPNSYERPTGQWVWWQSLVDWHLGSQHLAWAFNSNSSWFKPMSKTSSSLWLLSETIRMSVLPTCSHDTWATSSCSHPLHQHPGVHLVIRILDNPAWPCKILFVTRLLPKSCIILLFFGKTKELLPWASKRDWILLRNSRFVISGTRSWPEMNERISCKNVARIYSFPRILTVFKLENGIFRYYDLPAALNSSQGHAE